MVEVRLLLWAWRWPDGGTLMGPGLSVVCRFAYSGSPAPFPSGLGHPAVPAPALPCPVLRHGSKTTFSGGSSWPFAKAQPARANLRSCRQPWHAGHSARSARSRRRRPPGTKPASPSAGEVLGLPEVSFQDRRSHASQGALRSPSSVLAPCACPSRTLC